MVTVLNRLAPCTLEWSKHVVSQATGSCKDDAHKSVLAREGSKAKGDSGRHALEMSLAASGGGTGGAGHPSRAARRCAAALAMSVVVATLKAGYWC